MKTETAKAFKIKLSVAYVEFGGNTGSKKQYFYSFDPQCVYIKEKGVTMNFILSESTDSRFEIVEFLSSDGSNEFEQPQYTGNRRVLSVKNHNDSKQAIKVSIIVKDTNVGTGGFFNCDPQVLNSPGTWD